MIETAPTRVVGIKKYYSHLKQFFFLQLFQMSKVSTYFFEFGRK